MDGHEVDPDDLRLLNPAPGEAGVAVPVTTLDAESGFYVRRGQAASLLQDPPLASGEHAIELDLELAGVATSSIHDRIRIG